MKGSVKISILYGVFLVLGISAVIMGPRVDDNIITACGWVMIGCVVVFTGAVVNKNRKNK